MKFSRLAGLLVVLVLAVSFVAALQVFPAVALEFRSVGVVVSPVGVKLHVGENCSFVASAVNGSAPYTYVWGLSNVVDWGLEASGNFATVFLLNATEEPVVLHCHVVDGDGLAGDGFTYVFDPYTNPGAEYDSAISGFTYFVVADGSGWYGYVNGTTKALVATSTTKNSILSWAVGNATGGGSVFVTRGTYTSGSVSVPNGVRLIIEKGATGITASCVASATCMIQDWNSGFVDYYVSGSRTAYINWTAGTTTLVPNWQGAWNTTVQEVITAYSLAWKGAWNTTVEAVVDAFTGMAWKGGWNTTIVAIIASASISWSQITSANTTVQEIVDAYSSLAWKSGWNSTVVELASSLSSLIVSGTGTFGNVTLSSGQFPVSATYTIYVDGSDYVAKHANGTICWTSTIYNTVAQNCINSLTNGGLIHTASGNFQYDDELVVNRTKISLTGEGDSTCFYTNGMAKSFIRIRPVSSNLMDIELADFKIDGTNQTADTHQGSETTLNGHGIIIDLNDTTYTVLNPIIQGITVFNAYNEAICEYGPNAGALAQYTFAVVEKNLIISTNTTYPSYRGIHPHGEHSWTITENTIIGKFTDAGIRHGTYIAGNNLLNFSGYVGIIGSQHGYTMRDNHFENCTSYYGINSWDTSGEIELIDGNSFFACAFTEACIAIGYQHTGHQGITVSHNSGSDINEVFIQVLNDTKHALLSENQIQRVGKGTNNTYPAIYIASGASYIDIINNKINWYGTGNKPKYGIEVNGSNCNVKGNEISDTATADIFNGGTSNTFANNKLTSTTPFIEATVGSSIFQTIHDLATGLTPSTAATYGGVTNWAVAPTNLNLAVDNNPATGTTAGTNVTTGSGTIGSLTYDLGAAYQVQVCCYTTLNSSASQIQLYFKSSANNVNYNYVSNQMAAYTTSGGAIIPRGSNVEYVYDRYIQLHFAISGAGTAEIIVYEVHFYWLGW